MDSTQPRILGALLLMAVSGLAAAPDIATGQGIAVTDPVRGDHLDLTALDVATTVESQVAVVIATHTFLNTTGAAANVTYAFPMPEDGSATSLRYKLDGEWTTAQFSPTPQDSSIAPPGETTDVDLEAFLGETPLYFAISDVVAADSTLVVELTYVQLLSYKFGEVSFSHPNNYARIDGRPVDQQFLRFDLVSPRTIEDVNILSHPVADIDNDGATASVVWSASNAPANADFRITYSLSQTELGLFGFSTILPDSLVGDSGPHGFFASIIEPEPGNLTETIDKVFTLIVDRSGSMRGDKIEQAKNSARFIVENLNEGDQFNIVDFSATVAAFSPTHVPFNAGNRNLALSYIDGLTAGGQTNISGAFGLAVPQFAASDTSLANIIVFLTDGQATAGIRDTPGIVSHVASLVASTETYPLIFTFGIGPAAEQQLLTLLATENSGLAEFLGDDELEDRITDFYLRIRNPVLLGAEVTFDPPLASQVLPDPTPGLFKGQQVIVAGRYSESGTVTVALDGTAFGQPVSYSYDLTLSGETREEYQFLGKVWAKLKIQDLLIEYYLAGEGTSAADEIRDEIVDLSLAFGIISPFSSFRGPDDGGDPIGVEDAGETIPEAAFALLGSYPNPFSEQTLISVEVKTNANAVVPVKVYDALGRLVRVLTLRVTGQGVYTVVWDGESSAGDSSPAGVYFYSIVIDDTILVGKVVKV